MSDFETRHLPMAPDSVAPDGSDVRILLGLKCGGMEMMPRRPEQENREGYCDSASAMVSAGASPRNVA
jgi:hypothetical protein